MAKGLGTTAKGLGITAKGLGLHPLVSHPLTHAAASQEGVLPGSLAF